LIYLANAVPCGAFPLYGNETDVEEQTGRNADGNIVVDNPEALKKWNELSNNTRELLALMNMNETDWNNMLPKQRESELNCLS
jgi:hypothetical protein